MTQNYADQLNQQAQKILSRNKEVRKQVSEFLKSEGFSSDNDPFGEKASTYTLKNKLFEVTVVLGDGDFLLKVTGQSITNVCCTDRLNRESRYAYTTDVIEQHLLPAFKSILDFLRAHERV
jgi:5'-3' exonuclease